MHAQGRPTTVSRDVYFRIIPQLTSFKKVAHDVSKDEQLIMREALLSSSLLNLVNPKYMSENAPASSGTSDSKWVFPVTPLHPELPCLHEIDLQHTAEGCLNHRSAELMELNCRKAFSAKIEQHLLMHLHELSLQLGPEGPGFYHSLGDPPTQPPECEQKQPTDSKKAEYQACNPPKKAKPLKCARLANTFSGRSKGDKKSEDATREPRGNRGVRRERRGPGREVSNDESSARRQTRSNGEGQDGKIRDIATEAREQDVGVRESFESNDDVGSLRKREACERVDGKKWVTTCKNIRMCAEKFYTNWGNGQKRRWGWDWNVGARREGQRRLGHGNDSNLGLDRAERAGSQAQEYLGNEGQRAHYLAASHEPRSTALKVAGALYTTTRHVPKGDLAELKYYPESYPAATCATWRAVLTTVSYARSMGQKLGLAVGTTRHIGNSTREGSGAARHEAETQSAARTQTCGCETEPAAEIEESGAGQQWEVRVKISQGISALGIGFQIRTKYCANELREGGGDVGEPAHGLPKLLVIDGKEMCPVKFLLGVVGDAEAGRLFSTVAERGAACRVPAPRCCYRLYLLREWMHLFLPHGYPGFDSRPDFGDSDTWRRASKPQDGPLHLRWIRKRSPNMATLPVASSCRSLYKKHGTGTRASPIIWHQSHYPATSPIAEAWDSLVASPIEPRCD
ncbi:hypothetical protein DFH06DRAFT_1123747 [Mycena polygramma]|nr:hypothetical protein DFH06DRAFT_1123747 [Mycena polygramma]